MRLEVLRCQMQFSKSCALCNLLYTVAVELFFEKFHKYGLQEALRKSQIKEKMFYKRELTLEKFYEQDGKRLISRAKNRHLFCSLSNILSAFCRFLLQRSPIKETMFCKGELTFEMFLQVGQQEAGFESQKQTLLLFLVEYPLRILVAIAESQV